MNLLTFLSENKMKYLLSNIIVSSYYLHIIVIDKISFNMNITNC